MMMYCGSKFDSEKNWLIKADILGETPIVKYLYAFYFSCTTMLTIGYGDITPVNIVEMVIVLLIEIVGNFFPT